LHSESSQQLLARLTNYLWWRQQYGYDIHRVGDLPEWLAWCAQFSFDPDIAKQAWDGFPGKDIFEKYLPLCK
jgi:hypothetical protein